MPPGLAPQIPQSLNPKIPQSLNPPMIPSDHFVKFVVKVPEKLSSEAKETLRKFDSLSGDYLNAAKNAGVPKEKKKKGWF